MKRAVIFINGRRISKNRVFSLIKASDTILCADGGVKHVVSYGLTPSFVIGDQDSTSSVIKKRLGTHVKWVTHPKDKDFTDSELAIHFAIEQGFTDLIIVGLNGTRLDHVIANILYLSYHTQLITIAIVEEYQVLSILKKGHLELSGKKNQQVSLIPLDITVSGITTQGLKWELTNANLAFGKTIGVSNEFLGEKVDIEVKKGPLLVIHSEKRL